MLSELQGPLWLLAELTYACPLQCPYCSNPLDYAHDREELDTATWLRVLEEARALGGLVRDAEPRCEFLDRRALALPCDDVAVARAEERERLQGEAHLVGVRRRGRRPARRARRRRDGATVT